MSNKGMEWFRMHTEFANDPKIQMLSEAYQRRFVMLLCLRARLEDELFCDKNSKFHETLHETFHSENDPKNDQSTGNTNKKTSGKKGQSGVTEQKTDNAEIEDENRSKLHLFDDEVIAFELRIPLEEWCTTKQVFYRLSLINEYNLPRAWSKRQYRRDISTDRVRAYRQREKAAEQEEQAAEKKVSAHVINLDETRMKRFSNRYRNDTENREQRTEYKNPKTLMSNKFDVAQKVLDHLNEKAKRKYRPVPANLSLINARLQEGATFDQLTQVIDAKVREWSRNAKMRKYLRPATLFNAQKFNQYVGQLDDSSIQDEIDEAMGIEPDQPFLDGECEGVRYD